MSIRREVIETIATIVLSSETGSKKRERKREKVNKSGQVKERVIEKEKRVTANS